MERRLHFRVGREAFGVDIKVQSRFPQGENETDHGWVMDLSEGGMLFSASTNRASGTPVLLTFNLPDTGIRMICEATIVHSRQDDGESRMGAQFRNLGLAERTLLRKCIQKYATGNNEN